MSETVNYNLYLADDNQESFLEMREKLCGKNNSNMIKIDDALAEKADHSISIDATLSVSGWSENSPYIQTIQVDKLTEDGNGIISTAQNITKEQLGIACDAELRINSQSNGAVTVVANGKKPTCDIPVTIIIFD